ncbi:MAG TPA: PQQ-dependent sugar dehydrogenase, partial [Hyphomicrobiales bacterium]|nr:PQQ-dependent sugar dehydrogenase [Hyphomicrobiales bacterium]
MSQRFLKTRLLGVLALVVAYTVQAQQRPVFPLGDGPWEYTTFEQGTRIRVSVVSKGLFHPWSMAFVADDAALITEKEGRIRLLRDGQLLAEPVADLAGLGVEQLFDIVLHPRYQDNQWVYFSYMKQAPRPDGSEGYWAATAVARGRFDGQRLVDIEEVFVADSWSTSRGGDAARILFAADGTLLLTSSHRLNPDAPQDLGSHIGKILRLNDDGSTPADNPFVGRDDVRPEIFSYGHRTMMGLARHPQTGAIWEAENGPQGGDEVNVLQVGKNYGWPLATHGREYDGARASEQFEREDLEPPELFWVPSITLSSLTFYTGERFPAWKDNLFVGSMTEGRLPGTGHIQRIAFNEKGEQRRERLLTDLHQRIRYVGQGPDGLLYLLTDEDDGALLRIEPAEGALPLAAPPVAAAN